MLRLQSVARWLMPLLMLSLLLLLPFAGHSPELSYGLLGNSTMLAEQKDRAVEIAECLFNVNLASSSLAYAGATISHAMHHCPKEPTESGAEPPEDCSMATTEIFSILALVASFISSGTRGIAQCPILKTGEKAACAASVTKLLASLGEVGIAGKLISEACTQNSNEPHRRLTDEESEDRPALEPAAEAETPAVEHEEVAVHVAEGSEDKKAEVACSIKAVSALFLLGKAGSDIVHATKHCPRGGQEHEGVSDLDCSLAVQNSIGALGTVANTLATVAMDCSRTVSIKARCAVDVTKLITGLVEVAASATGTHVDCVAKHQEEEEHSGEVEFRRLHK